MSVRLVVPDSHGDVIDWKAADAFIGDAKRLDADEVVLLGDHIDAGGTFKSHLNNFTDDMDESYEADVSAGNEFIDRLQWAAPRAKFHYLMGNHEDHIERWASRMFRSERDANMFVEHMGPARVLRLKQRGIKFYESKKQYMGISTPGAIRLGRCYFTHGISFAKNAAAVHLADFGANVVFGHCHRSQSLIKKTVSSECLGAWCPGTLSKLQPLYRHTKPTEWTHGYAVQFVNKSGLFQHVNVSIVNGKSLLAESGLLRAA